ncbi:MAG: DUF512 domain-containing protein [Gemmatimonadota bacterium]|nr:DUF512 domain-containing protein [Gemmatimonadota bacterium]
MVKVSNVTSGSIAEELGITPGTELLSVNGREVRDFLDWEFLTADDELVIEARQPGGEEIVFEIERPEGEALGVELVPPAVRRCANRCEFCFIEGLPKGLRKNLYVRDDDYRLSFAYGNFATLSNLKEHDFERILEYRLSPLYVSVHATPWEARKVLLNNPRVPNVMAQLTRLADGGIQFHTQMVVVPGLNDGDVLEQSLADLWSLGDAVMSVAVVPVGLTQFSHLYTGKSMDAETAAGLLAHTERWAERARAERGNPWVFGSDELYLLSGRPFPGPAHYGDFVQIENGVGAVTALRARGRGALAAAAPRRPAHRRGHGRLDARADARVAGPAHRTHRRDVRDARDGEFVVRSHDHHGRPAGGRRHSPRAARSPRLRPRAHSRRNDQRERRVPRRSALHRRARVAADSRVSVVRFHRRAGARG